ncbi:hypothetical protein D4764_07G0003620 [Takifugu flavidus]|uniref:Uncharacterized protein n=1 Tax=Takifugu flavidus TaxID=433684 RepID=A0A5C6MRV4_9TELE|nr:hypothetical protein D4764_07G0003620 [Takifugu flavidus]
MQQLQLLPPNLVINPAANEEEVQGAQRTHQVNVQRGRQPPRWGTPGHQMNPAVTSAPTAWKPASQHQIPTRQPAFVSPVAKDPQHQRQHSPAATRSGAASINEAATLLRSPLDGLRHTSGPNPQERSTYPKAITPVVKQCLSCYDTNHECFNDPQDIVSQGPKRDAAPRRPTERTTQERSQGESKGSLRASDRHASGVQAGPIIASPKDY